MINIEGVYGGGLMEGSEEMDIERRSCGLSVVINCW